MDNNFTLDSTLIPIVQLKVKKKIIKYVIRYPKQNLKKSLNLGLIQMWSSNPNDSSQLASKYVFFILNTKNQALLAWF